MGVRVGRQQHKGAAAVAGNQVAAAHHTGFQHAGKLAQAGVATFVAVAGVEFGKPVNVNDGNGKRLARACGAPPFHLEPVVKAAPVGYAGQAVLGAERLDLLHGQVQLVGALRDFGFEGDFGGLEFFQCAALACDLGLLRCGSHVGLGALAAREPPGPRHHCASKEHLCRRQ